MKQRIVFTLIMTFFLSIFMTLWITYINLGFTHYFIQQWFRAFLLAWPAAGIISFFTAPIAQRITKILLANKR